MMQIRLSLLLLAGCLMACGPLVPTPSDDDDTTDQPSPSPCTDVDGDGYCADTDDCDDTRAAVNPGASEVCNDGIDNDCDSNMDCDDTADCDADPACAGPTESDCANGIDDDGDGDMDCDDIDCAGDPACFESDCDNGIDDDGDGDMDCDDIDCTFDPACGGNEDCNNAIDDDGDGLYDCADSDCTANPLCNGAGATESSPAECSDGVDNDGNGFTDCNDFSCSYNPAYDDLCESQGFTAEENSNAECTDGIDNDMDGFVDCDDWSCDRNETHVSACLDYEQTERTCSDGADNDGDGSTDCADLGCSLALACGGAGFTEDDDALCADGLDNDEDGSTDCNDTDCASTTPCALTSVLVINEVLADPDSSSTICDSNCDGTRDSTADEFVEIVNTGAVPFDLSNHTVEDTSSTPVRHTFGPTFSLDPGQAIVIFGGGTPTFDGTSGNPSPWCGTLPASVLVVTADSGALGFNNGGDTVLVKDGGGAVVVQVTYGSEGSNNQSLVRNPELTGTGMILHSTAPGSIGAQSPGTRADGSAL
jgi:hypothetical protein